MPVFIRKLYLELVLHEVLLPAPVSHRLGSAHHTTLGLTKVRHAATATSKYTKENQFILVGPSLSFNYKGF